MGADAMTSVFWMLSFKSIFSLSSFTLIRGTLFPLRLLPLEWYHLHICNYWYFSKQSWFQLVIHPIQHFTWNTLYISQISRVTICSLVVFLSQVWTSPLFHVWFWLLLLDLHRVFSGDKLRWSDIPISLSIFHSYLQSAQSKALA